jgi:RecA-family ATPase
MSGGNGNGAGNGSGASWGESPFDHNRGWTNGGTGKSNGGNNVSPDPNDDDFPSRKTTEWRGQIFYRQTDYKWLAKDGSELKRRPDGSLIIEIASRPPDVKRLGLVDPSTLLGKPVPNREWLMPWWVPLKRITALYGAPGEGKSTIAQMLATACAIGKPIFPGYPVRQCNSLLHFCEDDLDDMHIRQEAINKHYGCTYADLGAMRWLPYLGQDNALMTFDHQMAQPTQLFEDLRAAVIEHNALLVVNDTLADVYVGDENVRAQVYQFGRQILGRLALDTDCAVMPLAHPSVRGLREGSGESGSTGWKGIFKSHLYLSTPAPEADENGKPVATSREDDLQRILTRVKSNFARRDETIELRWQSDVFVMTSPPPTRSQDGIFGTLNRRRRERVFRDLFETLTNEGQTLTHNANAHGNYAPRLFSQRPRKERDSFTKNDFVLAMQQAIKDGVVIVERYTHNRRDVERLSKGPNWDRTTYDSN